MSAAGTRPPLANSLKLRPDDASALCGISKSTLQRWEKELPDFPKPSRPTPRVTLYDREKLLAFIEMVGRGGHAT